MVLATLKRSQSELSSFQRKVFKIDDHMGIAIAGLTGDGRSLCKYMRNECINHRWAGGGLLKRLACLVVGLRVLCLLGRSKLG